LLIDNTQQSRQHGAAIESLRNAVVSQIPIQLKDNKLLPKECGQNKIC